MSVKRKDGADECLSIFNTTLSGLQRDPPMAWLHWTHSLGRGGMEVMADRVLVHIDMERAGEQLVNRRLAYLAISRGRYDAQIYTNDKVQLAAALDRDVSHQAAIAVTRTPVEPAQTIERSPTRGHGIGFGI